RPLLQHSAATLLHHDLLPHYSHSLSLHDALPIFTFSFRFPYVSKNTVVIRRNGVPMDESMYLLDDSFKKVGIRREHYSPTSIYTDRKSTRLNSSHVKSSYAVSCLKKKTKTIASLR